MLFGMNLALRLQ